jgi:predicted nucleotide-binding protein
LTQTGLRIVAPLDEGDDKRALRAAALTPSIIKTFLDRYDGSPLPTDQIGANVLESMGVPVDAAARVMTLIVENAKFVGFLQTIKDKVYVDLERAGETTTTGTKSGHATPSAAASDEDVDWGNEVETPPTSPLHPHDQTGGTRNRKVFISHGKSRRVVDQLKELLMFGDFEPVVTIEKESVSKPVPTKVMDDMRLCAAGIIHVKPEETMLDKEGTQQHFLNQNVLIEIGAAMALYRDHFILLVEDGATLPSNLQGLYEVRYSGDELGYDATMKVLKALNQFKTAST